MIKVGDYIRIKTGAHLLAGELAEVLNVDHMGGAYAYDDSEDLALIRSDEYESITKREFDGWVTCDMTVKQFEDAALGKPGVFIRVQYGVYEDVDADTSRLVLAEPHEVLIGDIAFLSEGYDGLLGETHDYFRIIAYRDCRALLGLTKG